MRHKKSGQVLDRKKSARKALIINLAVSLIKNGKIKTTRARARALRSYLEKIITLSKKKNLNNFRRLLEHFSPQESKRLIEEIAPRYKSRSGGYLRLVKINRRKGDNAEIVLLEWV